MGKYYLPKGMRYSTLNERKKFYREEFDIVKVGEWFEGKMEKIIFAVIIGRHTKIYPEKYKDDASASIIIDEYSDLEDVRSQIIELAPESVYYDRNLYDKEGRIIGQELAFDLDPENITCPIHGNLADKMKKHQGLSFCELEFRLIKEQTIKLYEKLEEMFLSMKIVYSGRGFHIHVFDENAYGMRSIERKKLATDLKGKGAPIDEWVTSGSMRLIRLPYSLHGMVSRIVIPVSICELENFDPINDERCIPRFLKI
jgi:DNA primase catalytic subunit